jgi:DUF4097 and DUF4098 domain-containing protein YvlB
MTPLTVPIAGHADLEVATRSGAIEIIAEERDDLLIESGASSTSELELGDLGRVVIRPRRRSQAVVVRCPVGSDVSAATGSAPIQLRGSFGRVRLSTRSGRIDVERVDHFAARAGPAPIHAEEVRDKARLSTKSGAIRVDAARAVETNTVSGTAELCCVQGRVRARSVSGAIRVQMTTDGDLSAKSVSGRIHVTYPPGVRPSTRCRTLVGRTTIETDEGADCRCSVATVSGQVTVAPAV